MQTGCNVIISEQVNNRCNTLPDIFSDTTHIKTYIDDDKIHKSTLINIGTDLAETPYIWVNDIDCYLHFSKILDTLQLSDNFIQPFEVVKDLTETETQHILEGAPTHIRFHGEDIFNNTSSSEYLRQICLYGALSFIFNKNAFMEIGMMDEAYTGWGLEDTDLCIRAEAHSGIHIVRTSLGVHLWHTREACIDTNKHNNKHFTSKGLSHDTWKHIFTKYYPEWDIK